MMEKRSGKHTMLGVGKVLNPAVAHNAGQDENEGCSGRDAGSSVSVKSAVKNRRLR